MSMDLVLQGAAIDGALIDRLTGLANATGHRTTSRGVRLTDVKSDTTTRSAVDAACRAARVDHGFIESHKRLSDYGLVVMDMDSTLITIECIDEIADMLGIKKDVAVITEATMRGEIRNFEESLRRRVALLAGLDVSALQRVYDERLKVSPGGERMLEEDRAAGLQSLLVSGGFTFFTEKLKARLKLDHAHANTLGIADGKLTGKVEGRIVDNNVKAELVKSTCAALGIPTSKAIVMGDGANDLTMMGLAGISVAYHAKPVVRAQTSHAIDFGGLDVMTGWFAQ